MTGGPGRSTTVEGGQGTRARPVIVSTKGGARWGAGHPWIYRTDVYDEPGDTPGIVAVTDRRGRHLGQALYSPKSEIRLRLLTRGREPVDAGWWAERIGSALARRAGIPATAYRVVHAEADGLPSLIVDRYGPYALAQLLSAGLESVRADVVAGLVAALSPEGILLRNDVPIRRHEGLPLEVVPVYGTVPDTLVVEEHGVRYVAAPHTGQKTGAFLDQRENRVLVSEHAGDGGRALDLFTYHGSFALHLARRAREVIAVDSSAEASRAGARTPPSTGSATSPGARPTPSICCESSSAGTRHSTRSCSIRRRSPRPSRAFRARAPATRRSTCGQCGCSRREGCCSPAPAPTT